MENKRVKRIVILTAALLALTMLGLQLGLSNFMQAFAEPNEHVKVEYSTQANNERTETQVKINATPKEPEVEIISIELPNGEVVDDTTATYTATENGKLTFTINYKLPKTSSEQPFIDKEPAYEEKQQTTTYQVTGIQPVKEQEEEPQTESHPECSFESCPDSSPESNLESAPEKNAESTPNSAPALEQQLPTNEALQQNMLGDTPTAYTPDNAFTFDDSTGTITAYDASIGGTAVNIPPTIDGIPVIGIDSKAFQSKGLISVALPEGLQSIGDYAFTSNHLTSVTIPSNVTSIGRYAFSYNQLTEMPVLPSTITAIPDGFVSANKLTSVTIPARVTSIGTYAFNQNQLTSVTIPESVTSIGGYAFSYNQLTEMPALPLAITTIPDGFVSANKLTNVTIPARVTSIGTYAFNQNQLTSVTIPESVTSIGGYAFSYNQLTEMPTLPLAITTIPDGFVSSNKLTNVTIPARVTSIGTYAFNQNQLTSVTIPESITSIGGYAFSYNQLTEMPALPSAITTIPDGFVSTNKLTSVTIPARVTSIGTFAFDQNQLTSVTIEDTAVSPSQLQSIGTNAFESNCLATLHIPQSVTQLGSNILQDNTVSGTYYKWNGGSPNYIANLPEQIPDFNPANYSYQSGSPGVTYDSGIVSFISTPTESDSIALNVTLGNSHTQQPGGTVQFQNFQLLSCTVTLDLQGGSFANSSVPRSFTVLSGQAIGQTLGDSDVIYKPGYTLEGWYTDAAYTHKFNMMTDIVADHMTLYANWKWEAAIQNPSIMVAIDPSATMTDYSTTEHGLMAKASIKISLVDVDTEGNKFKPTKNVVIKTDPHPIMKRNNHIATTPFLQLQVLKPNGDLYTNPNDALMKLNYFASSGNPTSATYTVQTPIDQTKLLGDYTGNMTYTITLE